MMWTSCDIFLHIKSQNNTAIDSYCIIQSLLSRETVFLIYLRERNHVRKHAPTKNVPVKLPRDEVTVCISDRITKEP